MKNKIIARVLVSAEVFELEILSSFLVAAVFPHIHL